GYRDEAHKVLRQLEELSKQRYVTPYGRALIYAALGETDETFKWLETAYQQRANWMVLLKVDPCFDNLRSDPRFQDLMRRMNFPHELAPALRPTRTSARRSRDRDY